MFPTNYRTKEQYQKYVDEYMKTLDLQIENDQNNYKQNELYLKTGQQIEEMADTRSLDQKMLDTTKLIVEVRAKVATLTDPSNTNVIIEYLENNEKYLRFVLQNWQNISTYIKSNYGVGVQAQIFVAYIKKLFEEKTTELGGNVTPEYIFNTKVIQVSIDLLNEIVAMKGQITTAKNRKLYNQVIDDLTARIKLFRELERQYNEVSGMMREDFNVSNVELDNEKRERFLMAAEDTNVALSKVDQLNEKWLNIMLDELYPELHESNNIYEVITKYQNLAFKEYKNGIPLSWVKDTLAILADIGQQQKELRMWEKEYDQRERERMTGKGLTQTKTKKPRVKVEGKVEKPAPYVPFGKYIINRNDLAKGILKMRTAKGGLIMKFPTEAITSELCAILKSVSQNGMPSLDEINSLSTVDKNMLHKIVKEAQLPVPVPDLKLDKNESEYRRFLLLKGEILAGQNNANSIRELKRIIIKLTAEGRLPRAQSNMVLHELAMLDM